MLRTLLVSLLILAAGITTLTAATDGFKAFTTATAFRVGVRENPRPVPDVKLQTADGRVIGFTDLRGRWLLVDFIYTRCTTTCSVQGAQFARLQQTLAGPISRGEVALLSVSFDPEHDGPKALTEYQNRFGQPGRGWLAARPTDADGLETLLHAFGVRPLPDGHGDFVHNPVLEVVDPEGRLVKVVNWYDTQVALRYVTERLGT